MSAVKFAYDVGVYVQELRQMEDSIRRLLSENDPWPPNVHPNGDWHRGQRDAIHGVIATLDALVEATR